MVARTLVVALLGALTLGVAPSVAGAQESEPADTQPAETEAPATEPADTQPADTQPSETDDSSGGSEGEDSGDSNNDNLGTILLIGVLLIALVAVVGAFMSSSNRRKQQATQAAPVTSAPRRDRELLGNAQWLHDQLSLELIALPGSEALTRWQSERGRLDNMSLAAQQYASSSGNAAYRQLATSISTLAGSLDTACRLRAQPEADSQAASEAVAVVNRNRDQLQRVINLAAQT